MGRRRRDKMGQHRGCGGTESVGDFADYRTNPEDPFHALLSRTKSSNNFEITALPKWNFIRESQRNRVSRGALHPPTSFFSYGLASSAALSLIRRATSRLQSLPIFPSFREGRGGRDTPPGSLPERFRHGTILFRLPVPASSRRPYCRRKPLVKDFLDILFRFRPRVARSQDSLVALSPAFQWQQRNQCNGGSRYSVGGTANESVTCNACWQCFVAENASFYSSASR